MENNIPKEQHKLEMNSRSELKLTGIADVHSFNDEGILLETSQGMLTVGGDDLHITKLNLDAGEVALKGYVTTLVYSDDVPAGERSGGFLARLFK